METYVAYNSMGDLVAEAGSYNELIQLLHDLDYGEDEVIIGKV